MGGEGLCPHVQPGGIINNLVDRYLCMVQIKQAVDYRIDLPQLIGRTPSKPFKRGTWPFPRVFFCHPMHTQNPGNRRPRRPIQPVILIHQRVVDRPGTIVSPELLQPFTCLKDEPMVIIIEFSVRNVRSRGVRDNPSLPTLFHPFLDVVVGLPGTANLPTKLADSFTIANRIERRDPFTQRK